jgi:hypothetical protein
MPNMQGLRTTNIMHCVRSRSDQCCPEHSVMLPAETFEMGRGLLTPSLAKPRQNAEAYLSRLFMKTHIHVTRLRRKNSDTLATLRCKLHFY